jgi:hypothetical protein
MAFERPLYERMHDGTLFFNREPTIEQQRELGVLEEHLTENTWNAYRSDYGWHDVFPSWTYDDNGKIIPLEWDARMLKRTFELITPRANYYNPTKAKNE